MIDKIKYKSTIIGMDHVHKNAISNPQLIKNPKRHSFPDQLNCLNFNEKSGILAIKRSDITVITGTKTMGFIAFMIKSCSHPVVLPYWVNNNGNAMKKIVLAGVGSPINDSDCRVSILKLAKRNKEKNGINNPKSGIKLKFLPVIKSSIHAKKDSST